MDVIYLDNNATTRPTPQVAAAVAEAHESLWANPSSVHRFGQQVRQRLELARAATASLIGARPRELIFTSGGTESVDLALRGLIDARRGAGPVTLFLTGAEHAAVRELAEALESRHQQQGQPDDGVRVVRLGLAAGGLFDVEALEQQLAKLQPADHGGGGGGSTRGGGGGGVGIVSVQWANNETGVIQPLGEVARVVGRAKEQGAEVWLHTDATQAAGKLPVDVHRFGESGVRSAGGGIDLLSFAGHKFHGPKGIGGLWLRRGVRLRPQQHGGPQEMERRGGTENVPGVLGMGVAAEQAAAFVADAPRVAALAALRDRLEAKVRQGLRAAGLAEALGPTVNGPPPAGAGGALPGAGGDTGVGAGAGAGGGGGRRGGAAVEHQQPGLPRP